MKKLMFATALVASAAAFADPINAISFEGYDLTQQDLTVGNKADTPDASGGDNGMYFYFDGTGDGSSVKLFGSGDVAAPTIRRPAYFNSASPNAKYLELSTEGGILWRSINILNSDTSGETPVYSLGAAKAVAETGTYLDTLMQFTPTEDGGAPTLDGADKLAVWLNVDQQSGATNLMVRAGWVDAMGTPVASNFVLTGTSVVAGEWYRVTIKAVPNIIDTEGAYGSFYNIPAFIIYVNGNEMAATTPPIDASLANLDGAVASGFATLVGANKVFPSIVPPQQNTSYSLQGAGFKGSGALDDIVWTEDNPLPADGSIDFTLTWPAGYTAVSYTIDGGDPVSMSGATSTFRFPDYITAGQTVAFTFTNADGATKTETVTASSSVTSIDASTVAFAWADYLGEAVNSAYEIANTNDLDMLRKGVASGLATVGETFKQTADIDMVSVGEFAGIGTYNANLNNGVPFCGTYDGQGYKISNILFTKRNYAGIFNQVKCGTIKDLTVENISFPELPYIVDGTTPVTTNEYGGAIVGNAGLGATLLRLEAKGSFGSASNPATHNIAGIAVRVCGGASNVVDGVALLETLVKDCTNSAALYGNYTKAGGITALTQDQNGVPNDYVKFDGCVNKGTITMDALIPGTYNVAGRDGLAGIVGYTTDGTKLKDCVNTGTYSSTFGTAKTAELVAYHHGKILEDLGGNSADATKKMVQTQQAASIVGFKYATTDNGVATTVLPPLAKDTRYLLEGNVAASETPVFTLAATGDFIEFDTALGYTFAGTVAGEGVTNETTGTVIKYWIPSAAPAGYEVVIGNDTEHPVSVTLEDADLAIIDAMGVDTNDVAAVNYALNTVITNGVKAWEFAILGLPPSEAALDTFKIDSITIASDGKVTVVMDNGVAPKLNRGVDITLKVLGSSNLTTWDPTPLATVTNPVVSQGTPIEFPAITPGNGETKKFYKVVVEFSATSVAQ